MDPGHCDVGTEDSPGPLPIVSGEEMVRKIQAALPEISKSTPKAFYSSLVDVITLDPAAMMIHLTDHQVHRGHAVFDTANIIQGHIYNLAPHLRRFKKSCVKAGIELHIPEEKISKILVDLASASGVRDGAFLRYWASPGPGGFGIKSIECPKAVFTAVVHLDAFAASRGGASGAISEVTIRDEPGSIPIKPAFLASMKSTNYLVNALVAEKASKLGGTLGIQIDANGYIVEGSVQAIAFVFKNSRGESELVFPASDSSLPSVSVMRIKELAIERGIVDNVVTRPVTEVEAKSNAIEMIALGGGFVSPITILDGEQVGTGEIGEIGKMLIQAVEWDITSGPNLIPIPQYPEMRDV